MRHQHLIRAVESDRYPTQIVCLDCDYRWMDNAHLSAAQQATLISWEAVGFSGTAGNYGKDVIRHGRTAEEFWAALRTRARHGGCVWTFSRQAGLVWTLLGLWEMVERREIHMCGCDCRTEREPGRRKSATARVLAVLEEPPFILDIGFADLPGRLKILDVANYGLQPSALGEGAATVVANVAAFVRGMVAALRSNGFGSLKHTSGSQALFSFKRNYLTHLMQVHNDPRALSIEGNSYYGGRCEALRLGHISGRCYHLDVSSMYPFCAATNTVPVSLGGTVVDIPPGDNELLGEGCGLIAEVTIETDEPAYPYRDLKRGITIWPIGTFRTTLAGPELLDALDNGRIKRWHRCATYSMAPALAKYMRCVLTMRQQFVDNDDLRNWAKSLGVSLIGKLGQKDKRWVDDTTNLFHGPWDTWWESREKDQWQRWRSISGYTQKEEIGEWSYDALPAVASWITSLARIRLLDLIRCAKWENVYYIDTDALAVSENGYLNLARSKYLRNDEPGFLRIKSETRRLTIHGIKHYTMDATDCAAGRPAARAGSVNGSHRYWQSRRINGCCHERRRPSAERFSVSFVHKNQYQHGLVCADGSVMPHQICEE